METPTCAPLPWGGRITVPVLDRARGRQPPSLGNVFSVTRTGSEHMLGWLRVVYLRPG